MRKTLSVTAISTLAVALILGLIALAVPVYASEHPCRWVYETPPGVKEYKPFLIYPGETAGLAISFKMSDEPLVVFPAVVKFPDVPVDAETMVANFEFEGKLCVGSKEAVMAWMALQLFGSEVQPAEKATPEPTATEEPTATASSRHPSLSEAECNTRRGKVGTDPSNNDEWVQFCRGNNVSGSLIRDQDKVLVCETPCYIPNVQFIGETWNGTTLYAPGEPIRQGLRLHTD